MLLNTSEVHEDVEREFTKNSSLFHIFRDPLRHMQTDFISEVPYKIMGNLTNLYCLSSI